MVWLFSKGSIEVFSEDADRLEGLWCHNSDALLLSLPMLASGGVSDRPMEENATRRWHSHA